MTTPQDVTPEKRFVPATLPWLVGAGALLLYLFTLNTWVSFTSLGHVARVSGWTAWQPDMSGPLFWLLTLPFQLLPARAVPIALNLLAALCAALALVQLARSVALLPHDRTEAQRIREKSPFALLSIRAAWLPPLLAAAVCGLQLTFWENATSASSEIFDLLLFAFIIRCLLEFRLEGRDTWLFRAALVYGAAITNNWAMLGFLPLFLVALVWFKGLSVFNGRFLGRLSLLALAGLSLYLLLPIVNAASSEAGFWESLRADLGSQKFYLSRLAFNKLALFKGDRPLWVLALPSLVPVLLLSIRWPAAFGDTSKLGQGLANFILNITYGVFLLLCSWVALDPARFGPRHLLPQIPMLTLYYLGALSIGYFVGYFLLVCGAKPAGRPRPTPAYAPLVKGLVLTGVVLLSLLTPFLLVYRNLPQLRITNGPMLRQYTGLLARDLPAQHPIVLSDDPGKLLLLQAAFTREQRPAGPVLVSSSWLQFPAYHRFLKKQYPAIWPTEPAPDRKDIIPGMELAFLMQHLSRSNAIYYLHPSFGYYFEIFYAQPHGLVYQLLPYPTNTLIAPKLSSQLIEQNEDFWNGINGSTLKPLIAAIKPPARVEDLGLLDRLCRRLRLATESNPGAAQLASFYSRGLDYWGVELQRAEPPLLAQATARFNEALALNPDNLAAQANLECNRDLRASQVPSVKVPAAIQDQFGKYRGWDDIMSANGPFDHPSFLFAQATTYAYPKGNNLAAQYRQAAQQFLRVTQLVPDDLDSRLRLAELYVFTRLSDEALKIVNDVHARAASFNLSSTNRAWLFAIETAAHLAKGDVSGAETVVQNALKPNPDDEALLSAASRVYMTYGCYTNALVTIARQLKIRPDDPDALYGNGLAYFQLKLYPRAIDSFSQVLQVVTNRASDLHAFSLLYRAQACAASDKLDDARRDYEALQRDVPTAFSIYKELADLALRKQDTNAALRNLNLYLSHLPTNNVQEIKAVTERIHQLRPGSR